MRSTIVVYFGASALATLVYVFGAAIGYRKGWNDHSRAPDLQIVSRSPGPSRLQVEIASAAVAVLAAVVLIVPATAAIASSLPGQPLWRAKLGLEQVQLAMAGDERAKARLHLEFAERRMSELEAVGSFADQRLLEEVTASVQSHTEAAAVHLNEFDDGDSSAASLSERVQRMKDRNGDTGSGAAAVPSRRSGDSAAADTPGTGRTGAADDRADADAGQADDPGSAPRSSATPGAADGPPAEADGQEPPRRLDDVPTPPVVPYRPTPPTTTDADERCDPEDDPSELSPPPAVISPPVETPVSLPSCEPPEPEGSGRQNRDRRAARAASPDPKLGSGRSAGSAAQTESPAPDADKPPAAEDAVKPPAAQDAVKPPAAEDAVKPPAAQDAVKPSSSAPRPDPEDLGEASPDSAASGARGRGRCNGAECSLERGPPAAEPECASDAGQGWRLNDAPLSDLDASPQPESSDGVGALGGNWSGELSSELA